VLERRVAFVSQGLSFVKYPDGHAQWREERKVEKSKKRI